MDSDQNDYLVELKLSIDEFFSSGDLQVAMKILHDAHKFDRQIFTMGNGGSSAIAQHFSVDWTKGVYQLTGKALRTNCLSSNFPIHSAASNDISFEDAYSFLLDVLGKSDDVAVIISSSGESQNMISAANRAKLLGLKIICLSGFGNSRLGKLGDANIKIKSRDMQVIEDVHGLFGHYILKSFTHDGSLR